MDEDLKKVLLHKKRITDFLQASTLQREIMRDGLPLDLELIVPVFSELSYKYKNIPLEQFRDSMSPHQIYSKAWVLKSILEIMDTFERDEEELLPLLDGIDVFSANEFSISYFGSWIGFGASMIAGMADFLDAEVSQINLVDNNEAANAYSSDLLTALGFKSRTVTQNMEDIDPRDSVFQADLIVNTVVEHMPEGVFNRWWSKVVAGKYEDKKRLIILQSTNMDADDHVNKCENAEDLIPHEMKESTLFLGRLQFHDCARFMVIGTL